MAKKRPRRHMRVDLAIYRNSSNKQKFVQLTVKQAHPIYGVEVKYQFSIDEGTAFQLGESLQRILDELDKEREVVDG